MLIFVVFYWIASINKLTEIGRSSIPRNLLQLHTTNTSGRMNNMTQMMKNALPVVSSHLLYFLNHLPMLIRNQEDHPSPYLLINIGAHLSKLTRSHKTISNFQTKIFDNNSLWRRPLIIFGFASTFSTMWYHLTQRFNHKSVKLGGCEYLARLAMPNKILKCLLT